MVFKALIWQPIEAAGTRSLRAFFKSRQNLIGSGGKLDALLKERSVKLR
ncbi:MAG TPA: hypothetical protein VJN41_03965 [Alphaproteobacteria bacterium]|nr:hypothetical protein [Alphaproteobacteria bacterium]